LKIILFCVTQLLIIMEQKPAYGSLASSHLPATRLNITKLFKEGILDIYHAERTLAGALPMMVINSTSTLLAAALEHHMVETHGHINRLEKLMATLDIVPEDKPCETMESMVREGAGTITEADKGIACDLSIIAAAQKVEHFEIAAYGTLRTLAEMLDMPEAVGTLDLTLDEEKLADTILTETAAAILYNELKQSNHTH
jgi:ferritin-like metal-binding protein YciE